MCGIVAFVPTPGWPGAAPMCHLDSVRRMVSALALRGPDQERVADVGGAILGHARLSIIDLVTGSQPVWNESRTVAVILNGEIYNYQELQRDLKALGHRFVTASDTEVIAHLYEERGTELFEQLNGMFAAAIWDLPNHRLVVGRDRLGEKPVLYALVPEGLLLASEVKALLQWPSLPRDLDRGALCSYLNVMYVPAPRTIFRAIRKLEPGQYMVFEDGRVTIHPYWVAVANPTLNAAEPRLAEELPALLREAVRSRMVADVPVGVFLSGGIDSSAVTAFAAGLSTDRVRTFTVAFGDQIDERPRARAVADRYGTQHVELVVEECLEEQFERIYGYMDEPFADSSVVPTNAIAHAAREHVKVILSGDGGDELFAGYPDYVDQKYRSGGRLRTAVLKYLNRFVIRTLQWDPVGSHCVGRSERALASWHDVRSVFREREVSRLTGSSCDTQRLFADRLSERAGLDSLSTAFLYDLRFYLPDDLLKKVDMASMQASLECRAPLLDHRLVEWALKMPVGLKLSNDQPKAFLRRALAKHLPATVVAAPKQGFGAPLSAWIRGPLRNVIMDLTAPGGRASAYLDCAAIAAVRNAESVAQPGDDYRVFQQLWSLAIFEYWLRRYT